LATDDVLAQLTNLGVRRGGVLVVHTSFRAVRPVPGGPLGLVDALRRALGPDGTLVMPTMTGGDAIYDPRRTPTEHMGIVAELFWRQDGVLRSPHPGASFAAIGPLAAAICAPHPLSPPHGLDSPVGRVFEHDGQVLLLGVAHSENTTLHLAESLAPVPYSVLRPCVVDDGGRPKEIQLPETDHCCRGFAHMDAWLRARGLQREGRVGNAEARLIASRDVVDVALAHLRADPFVFLCGPAAGCEECDEARASVPASLDRP